MHENSIMSITRLHVRTRLGTYWPRWGLGCLLIEIYSHCYSTNHFGSSTSTLIMPLPRRFEVPMHTMHEKTEYSIGPHQTYIRHLTTVWVDVGLVDL